MVYLYSDLHSSSTHPSHISVSEKLMSTLTLRHREGGWGSEHLVVRWEGSVQGQDPLRPAASLEHCENNRGCSSMLPLDLEDPAGILEDSTRRFSRDALPRVSMSGPSHMPQFLLV